MKTNISNTKKLVSVFILLIIAFSLVFSFSKTYAAFATPALRYRTCDFNSGIVFNNYDHIGIESQVIDVTVNEDLTAEIKAKYIIKNYSQERLSANTAFFLSAAFGEIKDISIEKNGESLGYSQEFFELCNLYDNECYDDHGKSVENWENIFCSSENKTKSFGEGGGFFEYRISKASGNGDLYADFLPDTSYFYDIADNKIVVSVPNGYVTLNCYDNNNGNLIEIIMVSSQNIYFRTNGTVTKNEIDNIYDYLFENACKDIESESMQFAEAQFNRYLAYINSFDNASLIYCYDFYYFGFDYEDRYIDAIKFLINFEPLEQIELNISYSCLPGGRIVSRQSQELTGATFVFSYYLPPAKYAKDFKSFEINLTLDKKYNKPDTTLTKIGDKTYQYKSTSLPSGYLNYSFNNEKSYFWIIMLIIVIILAVAAFGLFLIKVAIVSVVVPITGFIFKSLINLFKNNKS